MPACTNSFTTARWPDFEAKKSAWTFYITTNGRMEDRELEKSSKIYRNGFDEILQGGLLPG
jgi:hypothetical protein